MKKYYYALSIFENGKRWAFAETLSEGMNILHFATRFPTAEIMIPCSTRKAAEEIAAKWNDSYRENGEYLFSA